MSAADELGDMFFAMASAQNAAHEAGAAVEREFGENAQKLRAIQKRLAALLIGANEALLLLHDGHPAEARVRLQNAIQEARS